MKNIIHQIVIQADSDGEWIDLDAMDTNNRYSPTKEQRRQINALKYEIENGGGKTRLIKRKETVK